VFDVPDIAAGDAIGSCMVNLVILAMLDIRHPVPLTARIHQGHVLSAGFGIVQLGLAGLAMLAGAYAPMVGWFGLHSLVFVAIYLLAVRTLFTFERSRLLEVAEQLTGDSRYQDISLRRAVVLCAAGAAVLVASASLLPALAERLATLSGLEHSFVGTLFVAVSTSLPEIVVSGAAVRIGAVDMAAANLFGSNLFNIAVLGVDDMLYTKGSMLTVVSSTHMIGITTAMLMTAVSIIGVTYRARRKRYRLSWDAMALVVIYVLALLLLRMSA
jgi:cation:H+ antiporter